MNEVMLQSLENAFAIMLSAMLVENVVLARGLGISRVLVATQRRQALAAGGSVAAVCLAGGLLHRPAFWLLQLLPADALVRRSAREILCLLIACGAYGLVRVAVKRVWPALFSAVAGVFDRTGMSSAVLGTALLASGQRLDVLGLPAFYIGSGLGFLLAILVVHAGYERLRLSNLPRAFEGLPIILVYIGILSMAAYGLIGHSLPA